MDEQTRLIVAGLRAGEADALRQAYEAYEQDVLAVAGAVLGGAASDGAWDVLHDVFVGLARDARGLASETNLRAYLTRAAVNQARDCLRRGRQTELPGEIVTYQPGPLEIIERDEEAAGLWCVVAELAGPQRVVVSLRVWGEMSFREIGEVEGISENTAQSRWRYALEKLREHYSSERRQGVER